MKAIQRIGALLLILALTVCLLGGLSPRAEAAEYKTAIGTVTAGSLRLRESADTGSAILATAHRNDKVVVIDQVGSWYKVVFNLKTGYMHKDYLELDEVKNVKLGYARFGGVTNVRQRPTTDSPVVARAPRNETCFIVGFNRGWYKVSYNGRKGYVRSDLVSMLETPYENYGSQGNTYREGSDSVSSSGSTGSSSGSNSGSSDSSNNSSNNSSSNGSGSGSAKLGSYGMSKKEKLLMIFGTTKISDYRLVYANNAAAKPNMTDVTVKTWDINSAGEKYTRTWKLTVHKNIAATVEAIFAEIYALPEKPPIHSLGGYRWANKSEHSVGLAIDINPRENYYCSPSGTALTGNYFRPDSDHYSIPVNGSVDKIFAKYGFTRGIYWRTGYKDYMHYSFFGT